jgi:hypothetical protein
MSINISNEIIPGGCQVSLTPSSSRDCLLVFFSRSTGGIGRSTYASGSTVRSDITDVVSPSSSSEDQLFEFTVFLL